MSDDLRCLAQKVGFQNAKEGEFVCRKGDVGDRMWLLVEGSVEVIANADWNNSGKPTNKVVATIDAPGYFGEMCLIDKAKGGIRGASIKAVTSCDLYVVMEEDFKQTVGKAAEQREKLMQTLRSVPFLDVGSTDIDALGRVAMKSDVFMGDPICEQGDVGDRMWLLVEGSVEVSVKADWAGTGSISEKIVATIEAPGYFGEMCLIDKAKGGIRGASIRALTACDLFVIMEHDFKATLGNSTAGLIDTLRSVPFLCNQNTDVDALARAAKQTNVAARSYICRKGDVGDRMWLLTEGSVEVIVTADWNNTGKSTAKVVATIEAPGYFGEMALIDKAKGGTRGASIKATSDVVLHAIMDEDFQNTAGKTTEVLVRTLRSVPFLSDMPNEVDHLARVATNNKVNKGAVICSAGELGDRLWLLAQGAVEVRVMGDWSNQGLMTEKVVAELEAPGYFGEMALLTDDGKRNATIVALVDCDVYEVTREVFESTVMQNKQAREAASLVGANRRHQLKLMAPKVARLDPYMIGTASIAYIYEKDRQAIIANSHACACSMGSATERTISCPLHRPAEGKSTFLGRVAPAMYNPEEMSKEDLAMRSNHFVDKGMYPEAIDLLNRLLFFEPDNAVAFRDRSSCYGAIRLYDRALLDAQEYVSRVPDDPYGWLRVADSFYGMRRYDAARKAYIRAGKLSPSADFTRKVSILFDNARYRHNSMRVACPGLVGEQQNTRTRPTTAVRFSSPKQVFICSMCLMPHPCKCKLRRRSPHESVASRCRSAGVVVSPNFSGKD